jgi:transposase
MAYVMVSKFCEHLPMYRQQDVLGRHGIFVARSTLCGWMARCAVVLRQVVESFRRRIMQSAVVNADETTVPVLDRTRDS